MRPFDAVFMALAMGQLAQPPRHWWFAASAPAVSFAVQLTPLDRFGVPITALLVCLLVPRFWPVAMLLAFPSYEGLFDVGRSVLLWLGLAILLHSLNDRLDDEELPERFRGLSLRLFCLGVLYYTLLPLAYL